ncbi:MAG: hypothetical protein OHK0022_44320 [Roseiflexaceae bacterium]
MSDQQDALWPLSAAQHGIWAGQQLAPGSPLYNTAECVEIAGPLDPALFEAALRRAVGEAEALHARVVVTSDGPRQRIAPQDDWPLHTADLSSEPDPWAAAEGWMRRDLATPVDLAQGPLFAQALFRAGPARFFWYQRVHHLALDGYGVALLARRTAELYSALAEGQPARGTPLGRLLPVLEEDSAYHASPDCARDRDFWAARMAGCPAPVSLAQRIAPAAGCIRQTADLPPEAEAGLRAAARSLGLGWPDLLIAAFAAYLHHATGANEVVLGLPVMGRLGSAALRVACMAMNIVPLRLSLPREANLAELGRQVAGELRAIRPHQRYRYEQLRRELRLIGGERRLFGPVVNLMPFDTELRFAGAPAVSHNLSAGPVEDLSLGVRARAGAPLRIELDANPACYRANELAEHTHHFLALLEEQAAHPEQPIRPLWRGATLDGGPLPAPPRPVVEQIAARAQEQPNAIALEHDGARVSYRELVDAASQLATRLAAHGAGPDRLVAVLLPRGSAALLAILGTLFAGAGYLPLDPRGPAARNAAILDEATPALIVSETAYTAAIPQRHAAQALLLDAPAPVAPPHQPWAGDVAGAADLAYVIYTSGSTGQPKGVQISRGALAAFVAGATARYGIDRADRVLQFAPLHFDASVEEIFLTLCAGATLVLRDEAMLQSLPRFLAACADQAISVLDLPTAFWHELAYSLAGGATLPARLRLVIIGGEAALPARVAQWRAAVGSRVRLLNTYGPTEATVVATVADLTVSDTSDPNAPVPIGLPLPGVQAFVLDQDQRPVAPGATGELYLGGATLAHGYQAQPGLTAERFVAFGEGIGGWGLGTGEGFASPSPQPLAPSPRFYKTGDLVRQRQDGLLVFVGRADEEFKISGHRVHPAEIERVLLACPGVREAAVVGQVLPDGTRRLVAHVAADGALAAAELRARVGAELPAALVPGVFVFAQRLPRSSTGKIDRAALRAVEPEQEQAAHPVASGLEQMLLRVWGQVLGQGNLSIEDDFFERGGQSLQTIQVANRIGIALGREVPVALLFRHPTVAGLARALAGEDAPRPATLPEALYADTLLTSDVVPPDLGPVQVVWPPQRVLLTGATGFVGAWLLHELLARTGAEVVCLVRAGDAAQAAERVRAALAAQGLPDHTRAPRFRAIPADLSQPLLGLEAGLFGELAAGCDAIYHSAAVVSVMREYTSMRAVNVGSTRELLRLAAAVRPMPLHHLSTLAVAPPLAHSPLVEEAFVPAHAGLHDGYQQSKWAAERLVQQAGQRGLPVAVYRLGRVVGATETGYVNENDLIWQLLRAGLPAGALPDLDLSEVWTPVDYVAQAIVQLSGGVTTPSGVFNLAPAPALHLADLAAWARDYGYPVELRPLAEWCALVQPGASEANQATLAFFDRQDLPATGAPLGLGRICCERTLAGLADSGIACPPAGRTLLHRALDYCVAHGLLPPPEAPQRRGGHRG